MLRFVLGLAFVPTAVFVLAGCVQNSSTQPQSSRPNLPGPVQTAVDTNFPGAQVVHHWRDNVGGRYVCEMTLRRDGRTFDASFAAGGQLIQVETPVSVRALPAAVSATLATLHPDLQVTKAEEVRSAEGELHYEVSLAAKGVWVKSRYDQRGMLVYETKLVDPKR